MSTTPETLTLRAPDDFHLHLRDGDALKTTVPHAAAQFARAVIMPNLVPPITTTTMAENYRACILKCVPKGKHFQPLMTLYLTEDTSEEEIEKAKKSGIVFAAKLYPAGATTHSAAGIKNIPKIFPLLEALEKHGLPLLIHGEMPSESIDIFAREKAFIDAVLLPMMKKFSNLKMVLEHISTRYAVEFVKSAPANLAATITAHHLAFNRNALLSNGLKPHFYCLPILKGENDRKALVAAATSGNPKFFLGTDSAPHAKFKKEAPCGAAGCYTAHCALSLYAEVFESAGALDKLEDFASRFGAEFYGLPLNDSQITLIKKEWQPPADFDFEDSSLAAIPLNRLQWQLLE